MYAQHHPVSPPDCKVAMKSCGRDHMPWKELGYLMGVVGAVTLAVRMVGVGRPERKYRKNIEEWVPILNDGSRLTSMA
jgi:hypothetical protein